MRRRPLAEFWAWLVGLVLPATGLAVATAFALGDVTGSAGPEAGQHASTAEVAGVRVAEGAATAPAGIVINPAPTATPRDSLSTVFSPAPVVQTTSGTALASVPPGAAVAGVQVQAPAPIPSGQPSASAPSLATVPLSTPFLGQVGGHRFPAALPVVGLALALAGAVLRGHTSAAWTSSSSPSRSSTSTRRPSRSYSSSSRRI